MKKTILSTIALAASFATMAQAAPLAEGGAKFLGNITTRGQVQSDFGTYWNQITAENECKWASIEGTRGRYNWSGCDACYNWAKKNNGHFKFHALVWGSQYPNWLNGLSTEETKKAITAWFDAVAEHYPDLEMIDVVNEAIKSGGGYHSGYGKNNNIIPALGGDNGNYEFVATAFKMYITEYDIGTDNDSQQKQRYSEQIPAFWESKQVAGITLWGYVYGATWTTNGNSGIIKNGSDRPAMTWLKDYFKNHLADGKNETGLNNAEPYTPPEPVPRKAFKDLAIPGKIEAEDFDVTGVGETDGVSNVSYNDGDSENHGDSDYRKTDAPDVDIYKKATGNIVGYNTNGDWYEYTVNIDEAGEYTAIASVAANGSAAFTLSVDGKSVGELSVSGTSFDDYTTAKANVTLPAGKHILRLDVTTQYFDIDYIEFLKGANADPQFVQPSIQLDNNTLQDYYVFDMQGVRMGVLSAYGFDAAKEILQNSGAVKTSGVYYLRSRTTGQMQSVKITK